MTTEARGKIFWSGGSQAVRLPREVRLPGTEVVIRKRKNSLLLEPVPEGDDWAGFWDRLLPLKHPVRRWKSGPAEARRPL